MAWIVSNEKSVVLFKKINLIVFHYNIVMVFAIYYHELAMDVHVPS